MNSAGAAGESEISVAHVLIVDDDDSIRETLRDIVEGEGHEVSEVSDGASALEALRAHAEPLVVVLDNIMPGVGGMTVLQSIAADPSLRTRHVYLLVTASPQRISEADRALLDTLSVPIIAKPFDLETFSQMFAEAQTQLSARVVAARADRPLPPSAS